MMLLPGKWLDTRRRLAHQKSEKTLGFFTSIQTELAKVNNELEEIERDTDIEQTKMLDKVRLIQEAGADAAKRRLANEAFQRKLQELVS